MGRARRSRQWWTQKVEQWRRSGLKAREFAQREGLAVGSLWWWSSELGRGTRAKRGSAAQSKPVPLEVQLAAPRASYLAAQIEVEAFGVVVRVPGGSDVDYVAALVRAIARR